MRGFLLLVIPKAHFGDIILLKRLPDGTFISGSKDNCVYKWDENGKLVKIIDEIEPQYRVDTDWITAATTLNNSHFITGKRNGVISLWRTEGRFVKNISVDFQKKRTQHVSHEYNQRRVTCLAQGLDPLNPTFFAGFPTEFEEYNLMESKAVASTVVHRNDWTYCIHPVAVDTILTVIAAGVEEWKKKDDKWSHSTTVIKEKRVKGEQRAFITSLKELDRQTFVLSDMKGAIKHLDIKTGKIVKEWSEHTKIVWTTEPLSATGFASCGDDTSIKIWDIRQKESVKTIKDAGRPVNTLLNLKENLLVAGTSIPGEETVGKEADIRFYDLRK